MSRNLKSKEFFRKLYQKKPVRTLINSLMVGGLPLLGYYMHFIEPKLIKLSRIPIPLPSLPKRLSGFKIIQISDIHFGPTNNSSSHLRNCIEKINKEEADIVVMTGDFIQWDNRYVKALGHILSSIQSRHGVYASLGNHDYGVCHRGEPPSDPINHEEMIAEFEKRKIRVLHNESTLIEKEGEKIELVGLGDYWTSYFKPEILLEQSSSAARVVLSHNPDSFVELKDHSFDLMLSGHVHGGQISLPFIGPLAVPVKHRHLRRGLHRLNGHWLYTNRGLGYIFKGRLLSRPEIAILTLTNQDLQKEEEELL